jgi:hypothetical protein
VSTILSTKKSFTCPVIIATQKLKKKKMGNSSKRLSLGVVKNKKKKDAVYFPLN